MKKIKISWPFLILAILALTIHFAFLSYPAQVVFDEVHFGKFVAAYFTGQYYFDIHPPLGKLMIAGFAKMTGANPVFSFQNIGEAIPSQILFVLRWVPAFFGSLLVLAFAWLAFLLTRNKKVALTAGFLMLLDNAFLVQSKFILVDAFLLFFEVLTLCFFFLYQRQKSFSPRWFAYLALTGIFFGLTISIKWTGLAVLGIIGIALLIKLASRPMAEWLNPEQKFDRWQVFKKATVGFLTICLLGFLVYLIPFAVHFKSLPHSGPGDAFMSSAFQQELVSGQKTLSFWQKFTELNKTMLSANAGITSEHPFGSRWYSWPADHKPVYYWNQDAGGKSAKIFFAGNPALWWLIVPALFLTLLTKEALKKPVFQFLLLAYLANLLPFVLIERVSFLYHYLPAAMFGLLLLAIWLKSFEAQNKNLFKAAWVLIIAGFLVMVPLSYGWLLPASIIKIPTSIMQLLGAL